VGLFTFFVQAVRLHKGKESYYDIRKKDSIACKIDERIEKELT